MRKQGPEDIQATSRVLIEGLDYYIDAATGYSVFTEHFLEKRGSCCGNGCRHCPYDPKHGGAGAKIKSRAPNRSL